MIRPPTRSTRTYTLAPSPTSLGSDVGAALVRLDIADLKAVAFDETASKLGHNYGTIFIDLDRRSRPGVFATPGKGKETFRRFKDFLAEHNGKPSKIAEV